MASAELRLATALRLAKFFSVSPDFWLNLQMRWDLYRAQQIEKNELKAIKEHKHADVSA